MSAAGILIAACCMAVDVGAAQAAQPAPFGPPTVLGPANGSSISPQVAVDRRGDAIAVWTEDHTSGVRASWRAAGESWSPAVTISAPASISAFDVAMTPKGEAIVVWSRFVADRVSVVESTTRSTRGAWSPVSDITQESGSNYELRVAVNDRGEAVAGWLHVTFSFDGSLVHAATRDAAGAWSTPAVLTAPGSHSGYPHVGIDDRGNALAVWPLAGSLQFSTRRRAGTWAAARDVPGSDGAAGTQSLAVNDRGDVALAWRRTSGSERVVFVARRTRGGDWSAPEAVSPPTGGAYLHDVGLDDKGRALLIWTQPSGDGQVLQAARRNADGWSDPVVVDVAPAIPYIDLAVTRHGGAVALWSTGSLAGVAIRSAVMTPAGSWSAPDTLTTATEHDLDLLEVAANDRYDAAAVWRRWTFIGQFPNVQYTGVTEATASS